MPSQNDRLTLRKRSQSFGASKSIGNTLTEVYEKLSTGGNEVTFKMEFTLPVSDIANFDEDGAMDQVLDYGDVVVTDIKE